MQSINVQIHGIDPISNTSFDGQLVGSDFILSFKPEKLNDEIQSITIQWEIKINATADTYYFIVHQLFFIAKESLLTA